MASAVVSSHAIIDGAYRYWLTRVWDRYKPPLVFVMLNPSTADATEDDPTIRKCCGFAERAGFGGIEVVNLYAFRASKPKYLWNAQRHEGVNIVGPKNADYVARAVSKRCVVLAWGAHARRDPTHVQQATFAITQRASLVRALRLLADGTPEHPLFIPYDAAKHMVAL